MLKGAVSILTSRNVAEEITCLRAYESITFYVCHTMSLLRRTAVSLRLSSDVSEVLGLVSNHVFVSSLAVAQ
jgi:hypothetical protein